ncbi:hypothetical protein CASFOL_017869 [Castilleja foliolosa]|uniref:Uncharacterized protein n=1 Tax=Castilleja foliolosa TaxID=1961234 RepID=A0ABD3D8G0_9LAMI
MEYPRTRLTRSACARLATARLAAAREENVDGGEPSAPRHPRPVKREGSKWASAFLDVKFSKGLGVQSNKELSVEAEEMAPGGAVANQKSRFARNNTSFSYTSATIRRSNRVVFDELNVSSLNESTHMPKSNELLSEKKITHPQPKAANTETQSTDQRSKSSSQQNKSVGSKSQSVNTETYSSSQPSQPSSNQNKFASHQSQSINTMIQSNSRETLQTSHQNQSNSPQPHSVNPETQSNSPETHSNSTQSQSTGRNTQSSSPENHSTESQTQSVARQMQQNAPQPESVGLRNEANSPPTRSNDTIQHGLRDETDDTNNTNDTNDTDETDETAAVSTVEKRKRGPTMGRGLMKALGGSKGKKMKIEVDPSIGRPKDRVESAKFSSQVGVVARDVLPVPRKWKEIDVQNVLNPCIDHMQIHMD